MNTDLIIIGSGASGLMAGCRAGELGLKCVMLERRHRPGLKLLMCGNNRCNVSHDARVDEMMAAYGEPVGEFLQPALEAFSPAKLRTWFAKHGLATCVKGVRIYPTTEKADDVLHCFTDTLRDSGVPLMLNCPVTAIRQIPEGFEVECEAVTLQSKAVLLATGGVSYPKTGSVGDGQRMLSEMGVSVTELGPGLAGVEVANGWAVALDKTDFDDVRVRVGDGAGAIVCETAGNMLCESGVLRGSAIFDATRFIGRHQLASFNLFVMIRSRIAMDNRVPLNRFFELEQPVIRPLKEAIVTVGGVDLSEIEHTTMSVTKLPGLYVCGELVDVDGPTGGYNLHAAFATGRLAVSAIAERLGGHSVSKEPRRDDKRGERKPEHRSGSREIRKDGYEDRRSDGNVPSRSDSKREERKFRTELAEHGERVRSGTGGAEHRGSGKSSCDRKPGNRWDNSGLNERWREWNR